MKAFGVIVLVFVGFFVLWGLGIAFGLITVPWHAASNIVDTKHDVIDKTVNAQNAIYNYEWFKQTAEDIKANLNKITNAQVAVDRYEKLHGDPAKWSFTVETEDSRLSSIVLGLQNQQEQLVADYNAHAKEANRNIFLNGIVPDFFDVNKMVGGINLGGQNEHN
jgi:hypothetical protein